MIVDDDPILLRMIQIYLSDFPAELKLMKNGRSALRELERTDCDLIITDIQMPEMDGLTLIRRARDIKPDVPVIVLSAFGMEKLAQKVVDIGASVLLPKPFDRDTLKRTIRAQLHLSDEQARASSSADTQGA